MWPDGPKQASELHENKPQPKQVLNLSAGSASGLTEPEPSPSYHPFLHQYLFASLFSHSFLIKSYRWTSHQQISNTFQLLSYSRRHISTVCTRYATNNVVYNDVAVLSEKSWVTPTNDSVFMSILSTHMLLLLQDLILTLFTFFLHAQMYFVAILGQAVLVKAFSCYRRYIISHFLQSSTCSRSTLVMSFTVRMQHLNTFKMSLFTGTLWNISFFMRSLVFLEETSSQSAWILM